MLSPDLEADNQSDLYLLPNKLQEHLLPRSTKKRDYKSDCNASLGHMVFTVRLLIPF